MGSYPDLIIIGAQRAGTTSFYNYLVRHPDILPSQVKEVHFFDNNFGKGKDWYKAHFPILKDIRGKITFEASPYYVFHPLAPNRIGRMMPNVKLVLLIRDPVERAYSHHNLEVKLGCETLSFEKALSNESERLKGEEEKLVYDPSYYSYEHQHYSYLSRGMYIRQIKNWIDFVRNEQLLVIKSEDFFANPEKELSKVFSFLGLNDYKVKVSKKFNVGKYKKINPETRKGLAAFFNYYNKRLNHFLRKYNYLKF